MIIIIGRNRSMFGVTTSLRLPRGPMNNLMITESSQVITLIIFVDLLLTYNMIKKLNNLLFGKSFLSQLKLEFILYSCYFHNFVLVILQIW